MLQSSYGMEEDASSAQLKKRKSATEFYFVESQKNRKTKKQKIIKEEFEDASITNQRPPAEESRWYARSLKASLLRINPVHPIL